MDAKAEPLAEAKPMTEPVVTAKPPNHFPTRLMWILRIALLPFCAMCGFCDGRKPGIAKVPVVAAQCATTWKHTVAEMQMHLTLKAAIMSNYIRDR
jgi:hypothetical protein